MKRARKPASSPVEEVSLDEFFGDLVKEEDWHEDEEKATVQRYKCLLDVIKKNLADGKVFKVGRRKLSVFIVGKTDGGDWAGLKTTAVET